MSFSNLDPFSSAYKQDRLAQLMLIFILAGANTTTELRKELSFSDPESMAPVYRQALENLQNSMRPQIWLKEFKRLVELTGSDLGRTTKFLSNHGYKEAVDQWEEGLISMQEMMGLVMYHFSSTEEGAGASIVE